VKNQTSMTGSPLSKRALYILSLSSLMLMAGGTASASGLKSSQRVGVQPTLIVTTSQRTSSYGAAVTLTANISTGPTGTVTFYDGRNVIGTAPLSGDIATMTTSGLSGGSHTITASWPGNNNFRSVTSSAIHQMVNAAAITIIWPEPASIQFGTPLSAVQLDASSSGIPGTFFYRPAAGTVLALGSQSLSVTFAPTDSADYATTTAKASLTVTPPSISVTAPGTPILEGTSYSFGAIVDGNPSQAVIWAVNGQPGGSQQYGRITASGVYTAPMMTTNETFPISAILQADHEFVGSAEIEVIGLKSASGTIDFGFTLPTSAATSAGVYDSSGNLVQTLWRNQQHSAGPQVASWNGKDDYGNSVRRGSYQIRVLYNNVTYTWGLVGDTSASWTSPNSWDAQDLIPQGIAIAGTTAYVANGYAEGHPNASSFSLSNPQEPTAILNAYWCSNLHFVATDGTLVYFAAVNTGLLPGYVLALDPTTQQYHNFSLGVPFGSATIDPCRGNPPFTVVDFVPSTNTNPTGLSVQPNGNVLAVSHGATPPLWRDTDSPSQDLINLFDKTSGAPIGVVNISNPQGLAFAPNGELWAISGDSVVLISDVGNSNTVMMQLEGLSAPVALAVDPSTSDVLVSDGGTAQQIKRYSATGEFLSSYGDVGGYTDCDPTVTKTRLFLDSTAGLGYQGAFTGYPAESIAVGPDSSVWFGDQGNQRVLHISAQGEYIGEISFLRFLYNVVVDHKNPSRVFADDLEYNVDYKKQLEPGDPDPAIGGNGSWKLAKNWTVCLPSNYSAWPTQVQTLSNGHTYALVLNTTSKTVSGGLELAELPATGPMRFSGQGFDVGKDTSDLFETLMTHNGDLAYWANTFYTQVAYHRDFIGYDSNAWPVWGHPHVIASVPTTDLRDPVGNSGPDMWFWPEPTSSGMLVTYAADPTTVSDAHHIGGVAVGRSDWSWRASPGELITTPDGMGTFPDGPNVFGVVPGIAALVEGSSVIEGYNGNDWTFSNQWMHWSEDGLLIGQFGHTSDTHAPDGSPYPGTAGNILTMSTAMVDGNIYLYNSDENYHAGIGRWTISGLDSIHEVSGSTALGDTVVLQ
jgi:Bacterial Ig-like domain (group 3)/FlgD Ig-like domain